MMSSTYAGIQHIYRLRSSESVVIGPQGTFLPIPIFEDSSRRKLLEFLVNRNQHVTRHTSRVVTNARGGKAQLRTSLVCTTSLWKCDGRCLAPNCSRKPGTVLQIRTKDIPVDELLKRRVKLERLYNGHLGRINTDTILALWTDRRKPQKKPKWIWWREGRTKYSYSVCVWLQIAKLAFTESFFFLTNNQVLKGLKRVIQ